MGTFKAIVVDKTDSGQSVALTDFDEAGLMDGNVVLRPEWSTVNYKDGLAITDKAPVVRRFPMIAGVDGAGTVETSTHPDWKSGDKFILNGCGCGETHLGLYAQKARVNGDWLISLPAKFSARDAMAIGTAGYTAMLAVIALERAGVTPDRGPIIVTGAAGGVGSTAVALLAKLGYQITASTGRTEEESLSQEPRRIRGDRAQRADRAGAPARQGALGRWHRQRRIDDARQCAVDDPLRRCGSGVRTRGRYRPADDGRAVHPARRVAHRDRVGLRLEGDSQGSLDKAWKGPRHEQVVRDDS